MVDTPKKKPDKKAPEPEKKEEAPIENPFPILVFFVALLKDLTDVVSLGVLGPITSLLCALIVWPWVQKQRRRKRSKTLSWFIITILFGMIPLANILPDFTFFIWKQYSRK
tara:strand:+ start:86 stop:418 length:333 start_codon:yes stop_codon:yes gene_type:complete